MNPHCDSGWGPKWQLFVLSASSQSTAKLIVMAPRFNNRVFCSASHKSFWFSNNNLTVLYSADDGSTYTDRDRSFTHSSQPASHPTSLSIFHFPKESRKSIHLYYYFIPRLKATTTQTPSTSATHAVSSSSPLSSLPYINYHSSIAESFQHCTERSIQLSISTFRSFCGKIQSQHSGCALKLKMNLKGCTQKRTLHHRRPIHPSIQFMAKCWLEEEASHRIASEEASKSIDLVDQIKSITVKNHHLHCHRRRRRLIYSLAASTN